METARPAHVAGGGGGPGAPRLPPRPARPARPTLAAAMGAAAAAARRARSSRAPRPLGGCSQLLPPRLAPAPPARPLARSLALSSLRPATRTPTPDPGGGKRAAIQNRRSFIGLVRRTLALSGPPRASRQNARGACPASQADWERDGPGGGAVAGSTHSRRPSRALPPRGRARAPLELEDWAGGEGLERRVVITSQEAGTIETPLLRCARRRPGGRAAGRGSRRARAPGGRAAQRVAEARPGAPRVRVPAPPRPQLDGVCSRLQARRRTLQTMGDELDSEV